MDAFLVGFTALAAPKSEYRLLVAALRNALDMNHRRIVQTAQRQWETRFQGRDNSDSCVSVRARRAISS